MTSMLPLFGILTFAGIAVALQSDAIGVVNDRSVSGNSSVTAGSQYELLSADAAWCGPRILYFFSVYQGRTEPLDDVVALCRPTPDGFVTLDSLVQAAEALDLGPIPRKCSAEDVVRSGGPAIVVVKGSRLHLLGVFDCDGNTCAVIDPTMPTRIARLSQSDLAEHVTGRVIYLRGAIVPQSRFAIGDIVGILCGVTSLSLVLGIVRSMSQFAHSRFVGPIVLSGAVIMTSGCSSQVASIETQALDSPNPHWDAGLVNIPTMLEHVFTIQNTSNRPIPIRGIIPTCSCATAERIDVVPAEGEVSVKVKVDTSARQGKFSVALDVIPVESDAAPLRLLVSFFGRPTPASTPQQIIVRDAQRFGEAVASFRVIARIDDNDESPIPLPVFAGPEALVRCIVDHIVATRSTLSTAGNLRPVEYHCKCIVDLAAVSQTKESSANFGITVAGLPYQISDLVIPITVEFVRHPTLTGTETLTIPRRNSATSAVAFIRAKEAAELNIERVESSNDHIVTDVVPSADTTKWEVIVRTAPAYWLTNEDPAGRHDIRKESIRIFTSEEPFLPYTIDLIMVR